MDTLRVDEIRSAGELAKLKDDWNTLLGSCAHRTPFLTHEWATSWWKHFGGDRALSIRVVREGGRAVLIAPLMKGHLLKGDVRLPIGAIETAANYHSNRADFIFGELRPSYLDALWRRLLADKKWQVLRMYPMFEGSSALAAFKRLLERENVRALITHCQSSPYISIDPAVDPNAVHPKDVVQRAEKAKRGFKLTFDIFTGASELEEVLPQIFAVSEKGWAARSRTALSSTRQLRGFYSDLAMAAANRGWLFLCLMKIDDAPVAYEYNLLFEGAIYNLKVAYDERYARIAPGQVLKHHVLSEVRRNMPHVREYDLLGDSAPYKMRWTNQSRRHLKLYVYKPGSVYGGALYAAHYALLASRKSARSKLVWQARGKKPTRSKTLHEMDL